LELIVNQLSASILVLSSRIPNQVGQVGVPFFSCRSVVDSFDINKVAGDSYSPANLDIV
jgi:hypothetical protein